MKKYIISGLFILLVITGIMSCKKTQIGYLSDNLRYSANPLTVIQGQFMLTDGIIPDNSTPPFKITLLNIRNKQTGIREESFFKEYDVAIWKTAYDPTTDTTLTLINAKRDIQKKLPFNVLPVSGQYLITQATENVPVGDYLVDLQVENPHGTKTYLGINTISVTKPVQYEYVNAPYFIALKAGTETSIRFPFDDQWVNPDLGQTTNTTLTIRKVANSPNQIVLKVLDKNGSVLPGQALQQRPSGNTFLKTLSTFAYKTTVTDTAVLYDYAQTRFPDVYWDKQSNGLNCYYRIYSQYIASIDTADAKNWFPPKQLPYGTWNKYPVNINIRFNTKLYSPGKYIYELKLRLTKK
ncbi:DUF5007 domain-containing protein [Pedobacter cryoconitis]|uniref:DUF5007 domain-containing protein n=1 Tax=Pedobacter cryoconitis TaxID=188932 RepID=A0A7X0MJW3_9SPHI|nr:DUF5007 domain-containing protein [Pedobacter cryoconitis]MBB6501421.1 hypothetical protein [Pedobacter cryoconitis]